MHHLSEAKECNDRSQKVATSVGVRRNGSITRHYCVEDERLYAAYGVQTAPLATNEFTSLGASPSVCLERSSKMHDQSGCAQDTGSTTGAPMEHPETSAGSGHRVAISAALFRTCAQVF